jgi:uncharacterized protein YjdB
MFGYVKTLTPIRAWFLMSFLLTSLFISANALLSSEESSDISSVIAEGIVNTVRAVLPPVEVTFVLPESITLELKDQATTIILGTSNRITPTFFPEQTSDKALTWTSDQPSIIEVTNGGIAVARSVGSATITASSRIEGVVGTLSITVINPPQAEDFTLAAYVYDQVVTSIGTETTAKIRLLDVLPTQASIAGVTFASNRPDLATINADGVVFGLQPGTVTITAQLGSVIKQLSLIIVEQVNVIAPTVLNLTGPTTAEVGRPIQLSVDFGNVTPTDAQVTFKSSHPLVARVNDSGLVMPVNFAGYVPQTTTITVYSHANPSLTVSRLITVSKIFPQTLTLSAGTSATVEAGKTLRINPTFFPLDTTDRQLTYQSSDPQIGTVSSAGDYGTFVGKTRGIVTITATSVMSQSVMATLEITVIPATALTANHVASIYLFVRKGIGHVAFNFINGFFAFFTFYTYLPAKKKPFWLTTILVGIVFGVTAESLQFFAAGRAPLVDDALYNLIGYFLAVGLLAWIMMSLTKRRIRRATKVRP